MHQINIELFIIMISVEKIPLFYRWVAKPIFLLCEGKEGWGVLHDHPPVIWCLRLPKHVLLFATTNTDSRLHPIKIYLFFNRMQQNVHGIQPITFVAKESYGRLEHAIHFCKNVNWSNWATILCSTYARRSKNLHCAIRHFCLFSFLIFMECLISRVHYLLELCFINWHRLVQFYFVFIFFCLRRFI